MSVWSACEHWLRTGCNNAKLTANDDARSILKPLDTLYAATQVFPKSGDVSYLERGGLYQGESTNPVVAHGV